MKLRMPPRCGDGYMLIEALVYIGLLAALLAISYSAVYRSIDRSLALRRNADDITSALHAGERWRADIRSATVKTEPVSSATALRLELTTPRGPIAYRFETNAIFRRSGSNQWVRILSNVKWSAMEVDRRKTVEAYRWDFELLPYQKNTSNTNRVHPIFTFLAVPQNTL
jgi:hypothetical protein